MLTIREVPRCTPSQMRHRGRRGGSRRGDESRQGHGDEVVAARQEGAAGDVVSAIGIAAWEGEHYRNLDVWLPPVDNASAPWR
jgi:hypothetical protein